ncbi:MULTISPECIES: alpha/beta fold hydrolase [Comamonadaceae]|uniref:alpha/beta fold hydrolase n=1 Tax=Comamonadaceae TaxID=80864 RepID=UPI0025BAAE40|nr:MULTISPECIES: alpha/beta fold hydrolase [Comamonadaceae]HQS01374.1 alpha/beta fold hydrolase [Polaromonas sp.]HQT19449.1 alpha/beta fold hydrolase [Acidovorax defluvii]
MVTDPLFPASQPRFVRQMAVGEGHMLYVEECAAVDGLPVVFLHGGPGSGCSPNQRRLFDPARYRAILVDQRGCGRSRPLGNTRANTTAHLVADLEYLREALGIPRWLVFGGSWGGLLALAYAQAHPERVLGLVLRGIFLGSRQEIDTYARAAALSSGFSSALTETDALAPWLAAVMSHEAPLALPAIRAWLNYERRLMGDPPLTEQPDAAQVAKVRLQMHYLANDCFVLPGQLLAGIEQLRHLPAAIVQGLADPVCPPMVAESLHHAWPEAAWWPVADGGHGGLSPPIARACIDALDWVATAEGSPQ